MRKKLGIIIPDLGANQLAFFAANYANKVTIQDGHEIVVFYETPCVPCIQNISFATMYLHEAYSFDGALIATNLALAAKLCNFIGTNKKFFYVWDLEWLRMQNKNFEKLHQIYANDRLKLIARSKEHAKIISDCWNVNVNGIVEDCSIDKIMEIVYQ
jgi:hypothetical protein